MDSNCKIRSGKRMLYLAAVLSMVTLLHPAPLLAGTPDMSQVQLWDLNLVQYKKSAQASSVLKEKGRPASFYAADKAIDGNQRSFWCEGRKDEGVGEWLELNFFPTYTKAISIAHGTIANRSLYHKNNRIKHYQLLVTLKDGRTLTLDGAFKDTSCGPVDEEEAKSCKDDACVAKYKNACSKFRPKRYSHAAGEQIMLKKAQCVVKVKLRIRSVYKGNKYNDTCVTEVGLLQPGADFDLPPDAQKALEDCQNAPKVKPTN